MKTLGCLLSIVGLLLTTVFIVTACESITRNRAVQVVEQERTEQVRIAETEATRRTAIAVDGNVQIAGIQADATKKTDVTFILFYLIRAGLWLIAALLLVFIVLVFSLRRGQS